MTSRFEDPTLSVAGRGVDEIPFLRLVLRLGTPMETVEGCTEDFSEGSRDDFRGRELLREVLGDKQQERR